MANLSSSVQGVAPGERSQDRGYQDLRDARQEGSRFQVYEQIPVVTYKVEWTKADVDNAIRQHELGMFQHSAILADSMTRDDTVDAVLETRVEGLLGLDQIIEPSKSGNLRGNKKIANVIRDRFSEFFPRNVLAEMKRWQILMGFSIAQVIWRSNEDGTEWMPELEPWHPAFTYVRLDTHQYYVLTTTGIEEVIPGSPQWFIYAPFGLRYAWMKGAIRSLAIPWLARGYTWRDWLRFNELYALGIRKAITPLNADEKAKNKFYGQVKNMGSNAVALTPQGADGNKFDVQLDLPAVANSGEGFDKLMSKTESRIAIRVNGQNLTTEVKGGALAAARVHENVKEDILESDSSTMGEALGAQVVTRYIEFHPYPAKTRAPDMKWAVAPPEDTIQKAQTMGAVATALVAFKNVPPGATPAPIDERAILEKYDVPTLADGQTPPTAAPAPDDGGPSGGGDTAGGGDEPPAPGKQPDGEAVSLGARARVPRKGLVNGQGYVDRVVEKAHEPAVRALKKDVAATRAAIDGAKSLEDLRGRLRTAFRKMSPEALAKVAHGTIALTHAAGAGSAAEDTAT